MEIHFSVDDTLMVFRYLTENQDKIDSIFETPAFGVAKILHDYLGINVNFYCMYTDGNFTLSDMPIKWKSEFEKNSTWLKFGFYCLNGHSDYSDATEEDVTNDYAKVVNEIVRWGGASVVTTKIRLHYFAGSRDAVRALVKQGIECLICADDDRGSYCLLQSEELLIRNLGEFYSEELKCRFVPTDIRAENISDVKLLIDKFKEKEWVTIFTHERFLCNEEILTNIINFVMGINMCVTYEFKLDA